MKIISAEFVLSATARSHFPKDRLPEIVLIGRSNVGKSSLINTFVNRKGLAKTSSQPGKTRTINFYRINGGFYIVDLPGFGYAKVSHSEKKDWERMMGEYMDSRPELKGAVIILDPRREAGDYEEFLFDWLNGMGLPFTVVFTKTDKLSKNQLSSRLSKLKKSLPIKDPVAFSSTTGEGKIALGKRITYLLSGEAETSL